jgi:NADH-quinone oxidoreductase subunit G
VFPPGEAKEDWAILRALSARLGQTLPYDTLGQLRQALYAAHPHLAALDQVAAADQAGLTQLAKVGGRTSKTAFAPVIADFYLTNPVARASAIMAECSQLQKSRVMQAAE